MLVIEYLDGKLKQKINWFGTEAAFRSKAAREGKIILAIKEPSALSRLSRRKARPEEVVAGLTALGDLLLSGVSLSAALSTVANSLPKNSHSKVIFEGLTNSVRGGATLPRAMEDYPEAFSQTVISMVHSGETSGKLPQTISAVAEHIREMNDVWREIRGKLAYPVFVLFIGIAAMFVNTTLVIPKIMSSDLFNMADKAAASKGQAFVSILALTTKLVPLAIILLVASAITITALFKIKQQETEKLIERVPALRSFVFDRAYFNAFSGLANLLSVGVRLEPAFEIVAQSTKIYAVRKELEAAILALRTGEKPSTALQSLSSTEKTMLDVAQSSDRIQQNFQLIADRYHRNFLNRVKSLGPKVYGGVMALVFGMFILMLLGVMVPYMSIISGIH